MSSDSEMGNMSKSSSSCDEEDVAEEENQDVQVIYDQIIRTNH